MAYCSVADVGIRLGLNANQRRDATSRINTQIRRATIEIDQEFNYYGRSTPSQSSVSSTLNGAVLAGATTITLASASSFATSGKGDIDGDSFAWSGKSSNDLTGVTGVSLSHDTGVAVNQGEMAHVIREICADLAACLYLEDEAVFFNRAEGDAIRANVLRERSQAQLKRIAHLGSVTFSG